LLVVKQTRESLLDGRIVHRAEIEAGGFPYNWSCVCRPEDKHDHGPFIEKLSVGLLNRNQVNDSYQALVGKDGITDCNVQIHGPLKWRLHVSWIYENGLEDELVEDREDPLLLSHPDAIHDRVRKAISVHKERLAAAAKAEAFAD
jgi:hypothetical protein